MYRLEEIQKMLYKYSDIWAPEMLKIMLKFPHAKLDYKMHVRLKAPGMKSSEWEDLRDLVARLEDN